MHPRDSPILTTSPTEHKNGIIYLILITFALLVQVNQLKKIIYLVASDSALLLVYSTNKSLYSYQILMSDGLIYTPQELYPFSFTALKIGEERIKHLTGYSK